MRIVSFCEHDFASAQQMHAFLRQQLGFPDYYGENMAALADCLGDISEPTCIVIDRDGSVEDSWFDKACSIMGRVALENDALEIVLK